MSDKTVEIIRVKANISLPLVPSFFKMSDGQTLPIEAVEEDELKRIGEMWTEELVMRARQRRDER